jgi:hypothetical protein
LDLDAAFLGLASEPSDAGLVVVFFSFTDFAISAKVLHCKISESFLFDQIFRKVFSDHCKS